MRHFFLLESVREVNTLSSVNKHEIKLRNHKDVAIFSLKSHYGLVVRGFGFRSQGYGSYPGRAVPKTSKMVLTATPLSRKG